jgi:hypothetical protein
MNELERTEMEGRTKRWGEMVYGPLKASAQAVQAYVTETAARWKQIADRNAKRP